MMMICGMQGEWHVVESGHAIVDVMSLDEDTLKNVRTSLGEGNWSHAMVLISGDYLVALSVGHEGDMRDLMHMAIREIAVGHPVEPGELIQDLINAKDNESHGMAVDQLVKSETEIH